MDIKISNKNIINSSQITLEKETDTLNFWFKEFDYDTIYLDIKNKKFNEQFKVPYPRKKLERDSLQINSDTQNSIDLGEKFILNSVFLKFKFLTFKLLDLKKLLIKIENFALLDFAISLD